MSRWDLETILGSLTREADALERVRQEVLAKRAKGNKLILRIIVGAVVVGGIFAAIAKSPRKNAGE